MERNSNIRRLLFYFILFYFIFVLLNDKCAILKEQKPVRASK